MEQAITIKDDHHDVSVSNIVIRKDYLKEKAEEVNSYLKELCMKKNVFLIDHFKSITQRHLNKSRLHLNSKGSTVIGETFVNHLSNIFDWRLETNYTDKMGCNDEHMSNSPYADNLKFIRKDNLNKLIIAHLNINSIRNKFDFLVDKIKKNVDIMMIIPFQIGSF